MQVASRGKKGKFSFFFHPSCFCFFVLLPFRFCFFVLLPLDDARSRVCVCVCVCVCVRARALESNNFERKRSP